MAGTIDQRGPTSWRVRVRAGGTRHTRTVRGSREDAERELLKLQLEVMDQAPADPSSTIADAVARWFAGHRAKLAGRTADDYAIVIRLYLTDHPFATQPLAAVTEGAVDDFYRGLVADGLGATRVRRVHTILRQALRRAHRDGLIRSNPAHDADLPSIVKNPIDPPSPEEVLTLIDVAARTRPGLDVFVRLASVSGARRGELVALRFSDLDIHRDSDQVIAGGTLTIARALSTASGYTTDGLEQLQEKSTKTENVRRIAIDANTVSAIAVHGAKLEQRSLDHDTALINDPRIFTDDPTGRVPWRPEDVSRYWRRCREQAGLETVRLHDLRHYMATSMMAAGVDITTGMGRGGWSNPSQFLGRYAHWRPAPDKEAADKLGDTLNG